MKNYLIRTLKNELKPALGCTEPIAISLACAKAKDYIEGEITNIDLELSGNIIKNAMGVGIPGTNGMIGIDLAAILGVVAGDSSKKLEVLKNITDKDLEKSLDIRLKNIVNIKVSDRKEKLYISAKVFSENNWVRVEIVDIHDNIVTIESKEGSIFKKEIENQTLSEIKSEELETSVIDIWNFINDVDIDEIRFILEGVRLNKALSDDGLNNKYGLEVGRNIKDNIQSGALSSDVKNYTLMITTAAVDARMDGSNLPAMSNSGSGDQGITAFMPVYSMWEKLNLSEEKLIRALALSNLIPIHIKRSLGRLSALCGATVASVGVTSAYVYLLGGGYDKIVMAMKNQIGGITGIFCDGAKTSCSLKVANSVDGAYTSAMIAMNSKGISKYEGIIDEDIEKTIQNMATLGNVGMEKVDKMILDIMVSK